MILGMYVCMYNIEVGKNERFKLSILSYPILSYRRGEAGRLGARSRKFCLLSNVFRTYASRHLPAECQRRRGGGMVVVSCCLTPTVRFSSRHVHGILILNLRAAG